MAAALFLDVFRALLAIAWVDGHLDPAERDAVLHLARGGGLAARDIERLEREGRTPIEFDDLPDLTDPQRLLVYALALCITLADGIVHRKERMALQALTHVLELHPDDRQHMQQLVERVIEQDGADLRAPDLDALVEGIDAYLAAAAEADED